MKVDYHLHLEEGPYSIGWLAKINEALECYEPLQERHSIDWLMKTQERLQKRVKEGPFTTEWIDLYLEEAVRKGIKEVGIVDHLYRFHEAKGYYEKYVDISDSKLGRIQKEWLDQVRVVSLYDFTKAIEEAKERWGKRGVTLKLGIEADYFIGCEGELKELLALGDFDYVIGSVHFLNGWGFDNPDTKEYFEVHDLRALYDMFFKTVESAIRIELFDIIAHLDNIKVFNYRLDENEQLSYYEEIACALVETNTATEINAGLYYRYPVREMCPSPLYLQVLAKYGVPITISSDAHYPNDLGNYVQENVQTLRAHGVTQVATFTKRARVMRSLEEEVTNSK
ncbi:histidinol phosphate phosphatase domain-containing protein [Bacillus cereus group sp. MYBK249-1]|uniref:histidinol phosphate phosphatase domain-containing protein n=1 Tax=Bacillus TaxID=1386 RepID=UPI000B4A847A|nr:histidinol phosphate phosphatase domain-containing protein [Bacillus cereus]MDA2069134.1 histidinol phosphate phosphatase domain-containing protein [Bacillus cereus]MDA2435603.1 histidinol phosphate phosphatase domain-containing protein [Bacillus cereus]MDA2441516.1 histidinol phosphate phosphatase domain-containing protein [Bacillus cereus]MDA2701642.1 histidinol phosphate phosphatase domain-containing protein [Bacillus cereus]MDA2707222.1 histidinol phosphate phosphatase domain-containing